MKPWLNLKSVHKSFDIKGLAGPRGVSCSLTKGKITCLLGPNGSGKTTLLKLIHQEIKPDSGSIEVFGNTHLIQLQPPANPEIKVLDFLIQAVSSKLEDMEKKIQLARDMADMFEFTSQLRRPYGELSQGQKQKVLVAADMINYPEIILMDEPFAHLDPINRMDILKHLFGFIRLKELSVLWVTHDRDEALKFSDEILLLQHGVIEQHGTSEDILRKPANLFVAKFFGQENFIHIKRVNEIWNSPWGKIRHSSELAEGYLLIPLHAWSWNELDGNEVKVLSASPSLGGILTEFEFLGQLYLACLPYSSDFTVKEGGQLRLSLDLSQCLIIPL